MFSRFSKFPKPAASRDSFPDRFNRRPVWPGTKALAGKAFRTGKHIHINAYQGKYTQKPRAEAKRGFDSAEALPYIGPIGQI